MAVAQILDERGAAEAPVRRWTDADAARTLAVAFLQRGAMGAGLRWGLRALAADPVATSADVAQRIANAAGRLFGARSADTPGGRFLDACPDTHLAARPDPVTRRRLARLERLETRAA